MAWLYHRSATWRRIVQSASQSPLHFAVFGAACFAVPAYLGSAVMGRTNPEDDAKKEKMLRQRSSLDHQMLAKANKERLAVLLGEVQDKGSGDKRYAAALRGESLGTHSGGTTSGAVAIRKDEKEGK